VREFTRALLAAGRLVAAMNTHLPLALQSPPDPEDEEVIITAEMLCASAARWRSTLETLEFHKLMWVGLLSMMLLTFVGEITWSVTSLMWALVMWKNGCRTINLCAKVGGAAMGLALVGSLLVVSGPSPAGKSATHFLELGCCPDSAGDGSLALRGLGKACMPSGVELGVSLPASDLDPLRPYHLVLQPATPCAPACNPHVLQPAPPPRAPACSPPTCSSPQPFIGTCV
jgi:hypothetical protein